MNKKKVLYCFLLIIVVSVAVRAGLLNIATCFGNRPLVGQTNTDEKKFFSDFIDPGSKKLFFSIVMNYGHGDQRIINQFQPIRPKMSIDQINTEKYPDPAAKSLNYKILRMFNHFCIDELLIIGTVENIGPAEFSFSGIARLYRGFVPVAEKGFGKLCSRQSVTVEFITGESFDYNLQGPQMGVDYSLEIIFSTDIRAKPEEIDEDMNNNKLFLSGDHIARSAYDHYAKSYRQELLALINQYRQSRGCFALSLDDCLNSAAQGHSEWMKLNSNLSHTGKSGSNHQTRCQQVGCICNAENIYNGGMNAIEALNNWQKSPGHNANLLGNFSKIGLGICGGWITAVFQ